MAFHLKRIWWRGKAVILKYLHRKLKLNIAIEHFQKCQPTAKSPKPADFYGPESYMCLWSCVRCGDVNVGLHQEVDETVRRAHPNVLLLPYWRT